MPQSLSNILVHLVFSTRDRTPNLSPSLQAELHPYIVGVFRNFDCPSLQVGGTDDHVHVLFRLSRTVSVAQVVEKVKTSSSKWIKSRAPQCSEFAWQAGYGAFSVDAEDSDNVVQYIQNQVAHHRKVSFQEEYLALLAEAGVAWDERYVWQ
jgi:putative transposase